MNRRSFLTGITTFAAQCVLDPELSLWKPGAKTISIPKPRLINSFAEGGSILGFRMPVRMYRGGDMGVMPAEFAEKNDIMLIAQRRLVRNVIA